MKRVLVTGAAGYIGQHMLRDLASRDYEVHAVSQRPQVSSDDITWHSFDLLDTSATNTQLAIIRATHLVHLAWVTDPGVYWQSPLNDDWMSASLELVKSFIESGGERAVLAGTCAEYDWSDGHCIEGTTPLRARSLYARSKLRLRETALELAAANDVNIAWARVFFSFGANERQERLVPSVIRSLLAGNRAKCSEGSLVRDFMYVYDVASAITAVLDSDFHGDINIASGDAVTLEHLVLSIACKLEAETRVDFGHYPRRADDPDKITADTQRLNDAVGWSPAYDLDTAIAQTIDWWKDQDA